MQDEPKYPNGAIFEDIATCLLLTVVNVYTAPKAILYKWRVSYVLEYATPFLGEQKAVKSEQQILDGISHGVLRFMGYKLEVR